MACNITFHSSVWRDLRDLDPREAAEILDALEKDHTLQTEVIMAKFVPRSIREWWVEDYRVLYAVRNDHILVLRIRRRWSVVLEQFRRTWADLATSSLEVLLKNKS